MQGASCCWIDLPLVLFKCELLAMGEKWRGGKERGLSAFGIFTAVNHWHHRKLNQSLRDAEQASVTE